MREVLIVGGGIGGVTAALCFSKLGFRPHVFEQAPGLDEVGAGIQLGPNCTRVLNDLGLGPALSKIACVPLSTEMRDWKSGRVIASRALGDEVEAAYGFPYYHIHRADLMNVLVEAARKIPTISLHRDACVRGIERSGQRVSVSVNDRRFDGMLLVGADGIHSAVRAHLFGGENPRFTGNVAWRGLVPADRLPEGLVPPVAGVWWGPHKHFVHYYV
ncbi:MAG: FAD-dependent monooxygenase, partial [Gammaproteobacteria bacterium]|nr:FAD-dependent monooxygenase [Gammaproteobacteria bacterium]